MPDTWRRWRESWCHPDTPDRPSATSSPGPAPVPARTDSAVLPENGGATAVAPYRDCPSYEHVYLHPAENGSGLKAGLRTYFAWYNAERRE